MTVIERYRRRLEEYEKWGPNPPGPANDQDEVMRDARHVDLALRVLGWTVAAVLVVVVVAVVRG